MNNAEARLARIEALAYEWHDQAARDDSECPDGDCGTCTMGNLATILRNVLDLEGDL